MPRAKKKFEYEVIVEYTLREKVIVDAEDEYEAKEKAYEVLEWSCTADCVDYEFIHVNKSKL
jgi:hypothetical protein